MKLLRVGEFGKEKPAALGTEGKIRDLSDHITGSPVSTLNFETLEKLQKLDLEEILPKSFPHVLVRVLHDQENFLLLD